MSTTATSTQIIPSEALLEHWQGHRRLTRRTIEAFPEDKLFTFSIGGMRPFGEMALELLGIAEPMVRGVASGDWDESSPRDKKSKAEILRLWDESTAKMNSQWSKIPAERFAETMTAFGKYPGRAYDLVLYAIDNEIHHRGQGYVYLRALGIEPPAFYDRS